MLWKLRSLVPGPPRKSNNFYFSKDCILKTYLKIFFKLKKFNCGDKPPPLRECLTCFTLVPALLFTKMLLMPKNQKELLPYFRTKLHYAKKKERERERENNKKLLQNIEIFKMTKQSMSNKI